MKEAELPDGTVLEFPDETPDEVMDMTVKKHMSVSTPPPVIQQQQLSQREQNAKRIAESTDRGDIEKNLEIGAQLGVGPVVDFIGERLSPPKSMVAATSRILQASPDLGVGNAVDAGIQKVGEVYNKIPQRERDQLEAIGLPAGLLVGAAGAKSLITPSKGSLATRRADAILKDVQPGVTKIRPAVEAAGHSTEVPVLGGLWKKTVETPSPSELAAASEVSNIKGYNIKGSNLSKHNAVNAAIGEEAVRLRAALKKEQFSLVEDVPEKVLTKADEFGNTVIGETVPAGIRNKFTPMLDDVADNISRNATLSGDARNVATDVVAKAKELIAEKPKTLEGLLDVRQDLDRWARLSDKKFFDKTGARQYAIKEIRDAINNYIDANAQNVAAKESLKKQSALYRAKDVLQEKAGEDIRSRALDAAAPSTLKNRAKNVVKHGASYVGLSK